MRKCAIFLKAVDLLSKTTKEIGNLGEAVAAEYLKRHEFEIIDMNVVRKTGEIDIVARVHNTLHFVEVKTIACEDFPIETSAEDGYDPSVNLHEAKIHKVARTSEWYVAEREWEGEWQIDAMLVWLRKKDGIAKVRYLPQIA